MDKINFACDKLLYFTLFVLFDHAISFLSISVNGRQKESFLGLFFAYCFDACYIIALQALGISHSKPSSLQLIPSNVLTVISVCLQVYFVTNHFCIRRPRRSHVKFFFQMTAALISYLILTVPVVQIIYPAYNKQDKLGKCLIALFSPLIGLFLKVILRICVQRQARSQDFLRVGAISWLYGPTSAGGALY